MDSSSDEDFVSPVPSTSRGRGKQRGRTDIASSSEPPAKMSKAELNRLRVAKHRAKSVSLTEEQQKAKREKQRKWTADCRRKKAQDELDKERERNTVRMQIHRSNQSTDEREVEREKNTSRRRTARNNQSEAEKADEKEKNTSSRKTARNNQSEAEKTDEREKNTSSRKIARNNQSEAEKADEREKNTSSRKAARNNQSEAKKTDEREKNTSARKIARSNQSEAEKDAERKKARVGMAILRSNMDDDELAVAREENRVARHINREIDKTKVTRKDGLKSQDILIGLFNVHKLEDTKDSIGRMNVKCDKCGALKFKAESKAFCCGDGKYLPEVFPRPPESIMKLWMGSDSKAKLFRNFTREINNAVALSSIQVREKRFAGFTPNVIFQGQVTH